tara:strand:+ start:248 stop:376 length:129 start_codon:yes stop_codon:yes gene_type:complete
MVPVLVGLFGSIINGYGIFEILIFIGIGLWLISMLLPGRKKK